MRPVDEPTEICAPRTGITGSDKDVRIHSASTEFFIAAALLALFGAASMHNAGAHGGMQLVLALLMGGAGALRHYEARLFGLAVGGVTVAAGGYALIVENDYFVGTIVAVFAIFRLWSAGTPVIQPVAPVPPTLPMVPFDAPGAYGGPIVPTQPNAVHEPAPYYSAPVRRPDDPA